jgi:hypothetical protein
MESESNMLYYNYPIKNILSKELNYLDDIKYINLCVYNINTQGKFPFLQYLLEYNGLNSLMMPNLSKYILFDKDSIVPYSIVYLSGLLQVDAFDNFKSQIIFDGFYEYCDNLYLFFDVTNCKYNLDEIYSNSARFCLIDEIINHKKVCNILIDENVINFFLDNKSLFYLFNKLNDSYELPIVGYVGKQNENKVKFTSIFGESAKDKLSILGPYFYFTDFENSINQLNSLSNKNKPGIVRFALFAGSTKYIENLPYLKIDNSVIKKQRLEDESLNIKNEYLTQKISDHDGLWSNNYDSVILNNIELDDGSFLNDTPMIVLKDYLQQIPLSYHYIHVNHYTLNNNKNTNYHIL